MSLALPITKRREADIQRAILALLHARGVVCWKAGSGGFRVQAPGKRERYVKMGHTGVADIIGVIGTCGRIGMHNHETCDRPGRFVAVEVKVPGKDATPEQAAFLASVRQAGGLAFVAHSVDEVAQEMGWSSRPAGPEGVLRAVAGGEPTDG